ncbi:MAG TPA: hypothetical protein PKD09_18360 [Aggregatilinea sp.]|nr:hypothetical protein [Aggregatilinea sp.]
MSQNYGNSGSKNKGPIPGINIPELIEDRNWTALGGLSLILVGILYLFGDIFDLDFNLWSLALLGIGGWLAYDGWTDYNRMSRHWTDRSRNRVVGGLAIVLVGALSIFNLSGWAWLLMLGAAVLLYDAYQRYQRAGRVWTDKARSRMIFGGVLALLALSSLINLWAAWPLILIGIGVAMLLKRSHG